MIQPALGKTFHEHVIPQFVAARKKKKYHN
jgi:hypothetical protein